MAGSRTELMTVREMIDAAIKFDNDEPLVDYKMLESVLYIIGGQLNVLQRHVLVTYRELKDAQSKKLDKKETKIVLTQLKIHRKVAKTQSATERYFTKKPHTKRRRSRSKSKSRSMDESGSAKRILKEDHFNVYHEKLLVVSRTQTKPTQESQIDFRSSIATQEQYDRMVAEVRKLQAKFGVIPNVETAWSNLHKPTSITDPKAALNMATRLEASYKKLNEMLVVITKFASSIPGINLEGPFDESFFHKSRKTSTETLKPPTTESEEVLVDTHPPEKKIDLENMATWSELNVDMENIRNNNVKRLSESATKATETARRANLLFKEAAPKLTEAQLINVRFARLRVQVDRFTNKANAFDVVMASQMSDCQENVTQMQYNVETIKERIDDHLAHPAEDPVAVAAIKEEFADMQFNLVAAKNNQMELTGIQEQTGADLTRIKKRLEMIGRVKTTREEALEALQYKARVVDVNGLLSREQLCAVVGFLQGEIHKTKYHIESGEINWQACIDDFIMTTMNEKCDRVQALTLNNSLRDYYRSMNAVLNTMLNIVGDYPVNLFKKKLDRDGNCLSCGTAADTKVSDKYMELARRMIKRQAAEMDDDEIPPKPCVPGRPIPHPVDPRALVCERYCGASVSKTEESLSSSLGLDVTDINPTHVTDMRGKVHLPCTPCTHSEETFFKYTL